MLPGEKRVYISLGSNVGDRAASLQQAVVAMNAKGIRVVRRSALYLTEPADAPSQAWFLNAVVEAETRWMPRQLLKTLASIDLDLLLFGTSIIDTPELQVPHPRLPERRFVLVPLAELAPALRHPTLGRNISELLAATGDRSEVRLWREPAHSRKQTAQG
jgi:2-amino-4-hydroxy-6-hydroxymethyldihydropteridine diphosphokinase